MNKLSVVLATYNEEKNIEDCIKSFKDIADEIIVFDESSKDKTRDIAESLGAKVYKVDHEPLFHKTKQKAIEKASYDWILQMDADERVTPELKKEIIKVINDEKNVYSAFYIKRKNYFVGKWMKGGGMWPDAVIRLIKKGKANLPQKDVHEQMNVDGEVATLNEPMDHYTAPTFKKYLVNANRYTTLSAFKLEESKLKTNIFSFFNYIFIKPIYTFLNLFIKHKGFKDGLHGFVFDLFSGLHFPIAYFKYIEIKNNPSIKEKYKNWE
jgi:glycosyltransferase involved in cell wall biosynthesis